MKQDLVPGMETSVWFTPTKVGEYEIACAELCGLGHYRMKGYLTIDTDEEYNQWLNLQAEYLEEENEDDGWGDDEDW